MEAGKKIYFASDFHLGVPTFEKSLEREKAIVRWLDSIEHDAAEIYLVGDVFDFWFEYKTVVPRGFTRLLGKLASMTDKGIPIHFFTGNHDMWTFDYLEKEIGLIVHREPITANLSGKSFMIGHGDGLGPGDHGYKFLKKVFANPLCKWLFARLHPNFGTGLALYLSRRSRIATGAADEHFEGEDKEWLIIYIKEQLQKDHTDYFIFGHRHLPIDHPIGQSRYINLGDWLKYRTYAVWDGQNLELLTFS